MSGRVAVNDETGEILVLSPEGQWQAPRIAENPQTKERLYYDGAGWQPMPQPKAPPRMPMQIVDDAVRQVAKGVTFGFADELAAGANAAVGSLTGQPGSFSDRYTANLATERGRDKSFEKENPGTSTALQIGGSLINPVTRFMPGGSLPVKMAKNAAVGGAMGAATGFGEGEGGFINRTLSALPAGVTGAAVGAAIPPIATALAKGARTVGGWMGLNNPAVDGQRELLKALKADVAAGGDDLPTLAGRLKSAPVDQPMILPDMAGEATMGLAQAVSREPGVGRATAKAAVDARGGLNQSARLADAVKRGISADDFLSTKDDLLKTRATTARPLYEKAFGETIPTAEQAGQVQRFIKDPIGQEALQKGLRIIELEHLAAGTKFDPKAYGVIREGAATGAPVTRPSVGMAGVMPGSPGVRVANEAASTGGNSGKFILEPDKVPNLRLMDAVKRGYDEIVEGFRNEYGKLQLDQYGRAVNNARAVYTGSLRDMFPQYGDALNAWAGPSKALDAMNLGKRVLTGEADETGKAIAAMSPSEKDMFRIGVSRALIDRVKSGGDTEDIRKLKSIWGSEATRERVAAAFDDPKAFDEFSDYMKREMDMARTNQVINPRAGSQTAPILAQRGQPSPMGPMLSAVVSGLRGDALGTGANVLRTAGAMAPAPTLQAEALAPYLFSMKAGDRARLISELMARETTDAGREALGRALSGALLKGGAVAGVQLEN